LAEAQATELRLLAEAEATRVRTLGEAQADKAARVGIAEAVAIEEQVRAYGGPKFQVTQQVMARFAEAIGQAKVDVVPKIVMGGAGGQGQSGSVVETLLALLLSDRLTDGADGAPKTERGRSPELDAIRDRIKGELLSPKPMTNGNGATKLTPQAAAATLPPRS
jgi:uncharacterized membrane protein YqiK